jgi:hypothetical protein
MLFFTGCGSSAGPDDALPHADAQPRDDATPARDTSFAVDAAVGDARLPAAAADADSAPTDGVPCAASFGGAAMGELAGCLVTSTYDAAGDVWTLALTGSPMGGNVASFSGATITAGESPSLGATTYYCPHVTGGGAMLRLSDGRDYATSHPSLGAMDFDVARIDPGATSATTHLHGTFTADLVTADGTHASLTATY